MINCTTDLQFLKSGSELKTSIHEAIDETIEVIFEHHNLSQHIPPTQITSKTNHVFNFYKYFHNHRLSNAVDFDNNWCISLFDISLEEQKDYNNLGTLALLLPASDESETLTKTMYRKVKSSLRLFFYILWAKRAVLLPFDYKPPKARDNAAKNWVEIGLKIYPETLRLVRNLHFKDKDHENFSKHLDSGESFVKDFGYQCLITSTWYSIEDVDLNDVPVFKEFYSELRKNNNAYASKIKSLPFSSILKGYLSYAPERCNFKLQDLSKIELERTNTINQELDEFSLIGNKALQFNVNLTNKLKLLLTGDALNSAIISSIKNTFNVILSRHYNKAVRMSTHGNLRDYKTTRLAFLYVFDDIQTLNMNDLVYLYELLGHDYVAQQDISRFLSKDKDIEFWKLEYSDNFKSSLKVLFIELFNAGAVLLPMEFEPSNTIGTDYSKDRYPELLNVLWNYKEHFSAKDTSNIQHVGVLYRAIIASSWRNVEDINLIDALEYQRMFQHKKDANQTKLTLALSDLLKLVYIYAPNRCNYTPDKLHLALSDTPSASLLKKIEQDKLDNQTGGKWVELAKQYLNEKAVTGYKSIRNLRGILGKFINHICIALPRELGQESELIPNVPNQFKRKHFVGDWKVSGYKEQLRKSLSDENFNTHLRETSAFFNWVLLNDDDPDIAGFVNPISYLDYVLSPRRKGTDKLAFPRRQFAHVHSFTSAVCEFYWYLIRENKIVSGGANSQHCYDTQDVGYVPIVLMNGKFEPIYFVPGSLTHEVTSMKNGIQYKYPTFQTLFENLIALETGLRHIHIRWLDRDKFDVSQKATTSGKQQYIAELHIHYAAANESNEIEVGTDKVKTVPWNPYVSSRVLNLLRRLKAFQDTLDIEVPELWYDQHEGSIHGKIKSLFCSMDATVETPEVIKEDPCRNQYKRLLYFYDLFVQLSGLDTPLLGVTSDKAISKIEEARKLVRRTQENDPELSERELTVLLWKYSITAAFYFKGKYQTNFKPHGTRSSVASEKIKVLPPQAIQDHITGHESRAVLSYYIQADPDWLKEIGEYNESLLLSDEHLKKTTNKNLTEKQKARITENLKKVIEQDPTLLGCDFGAVSFSVENNSDNVVGGLKTIVSTPVSNCAFMPTHICPFGGICPKEIKEEFGELQCGQCYFSVKTIDHIPRILAHIRKLNDLKNEKEKHIVQSQEAGADTEALEVMEQEKYKLANELAAWTDTYELLERNRASLQEKCEAGAKEFFVAKPDILMEYLTKGEVSDNAVNALLLRIEDANAFQEYFTPQLKAQITQIRNKILINQKQFDQLLKQPDGFELIDEFRGVLRAFTEAHNISLEDATKLLSEPLKTQEQSLKLLEVING
jgi:hypothetical protein